MASLLILLGFLSAGTVELHPGGASLLMAATTIAEIVGGTATAGAPPPRVVRINQRLQEVERSRIALLLGRQEPHPFGVGTQATRSGWIGTVTGSVVNAEHRC